MSLSQAVPLAALGDRYRARAPGTSTLGLVAFALVAAFVITWPMLLKGGPLIFHDTSAYLGRGEKLVNMLLALLAPSEAGGAASASEGVAAASNKIESVRSIPYVVFAYVTSLSPLGLLVPTLLQAAAVMLVLRPLIDRQFAAPRREVIAAVLFCVVLSPLPWYASYLMPDILAAVVILAGMVLVKGVDNLPPLGLVALAGALFFALVSHYGYIPLGVAVIGAAIVLLLVQRRLRFAALFVGAVPILAALLANIVGGYLAFDSPSVAPRRLPLLLARSIEDGPARWHLEEHCGTENYAICQVFDEVPRDVGSMMWGPGGLGVAGSFEQLQRIRDEELLILRRAFMDYPLAQTWSLARNGLTQLVRIGNDELFWGEIVRRDDGELSYMLHPERRRALLDAAGWASALGVVLACVAILVMARRDGLRVGPREREVLALALIGILANAAIFGGLSAPVERYQSRVVWILPVLAALFWLERRRRAAEGSAAAAHGDAPNTGATAASGPSA